MPTPHRRAPRMLVALDVDGTLVTQDLVLTARVARAVRAVVDAGHHVVIATGRSIGATLPVIGALGIAGCWAVCSNGAFTLRTGPPEPSNPSRPSEDGDGRESAEGGARSGSGAEALLGGGGPLPRHEIVDVVTFDPWPALLRVRELMPEASYAVETDTADFLVAGPFPSQEVAETVTEVAFEQLRGVKAARVVVASDARTPEEFLLRSRDLGLSGVHYAVGYSAWLDLAAEGVTKASALEAVRERLGVAPGDTVAVGDGRNDVEMLTWAARSAAMGGAPPEVVAAATEVTAGVADDGAALVLESLL